MSGTHAEQNEARQPARVPAAARQETSGIPAVPPPLTADALRAAQRGAGNAAVTAMIARRARPTPAPEQSDHGVDEVLNSAGTPLAAPVRQDMEARFGTDFSDVRLHTGAAAARSARAIGARAYTAGSHVVIGAGGGDRHTLAHELTHVVQQRQGPVSGTDHGNGLKVSDPSDKFEQAAEQNARRVLSGPRPADAETSAHGSEPVAGADPDHVQRKVGFEFEVRHGDEWRIHEEHEGGGRSLKKDSKAALINLAGNLSFVSADNGNVEFVTRPLQSLAEVRQALAAIVAFHNQLSRDKRYSQPPYSITTRGPGVAVPQATFGIRMENIAALADTLTRLSQQANPTTGGRTRRRANTAGQAESELSNRVTTGLLSVGEARGEADGIVQEAAKASGTDADTTDPALREVSGFLAVIVKILDDAAGRSSRTDDPKYFFPMMPRTDFVSMRKSLSSEAQDWMIDRLTHIYAALNHVFLVDYPVFPGNYKEKPKGPELTRRAWLDSVFVGDPATAKDLLSPPPGYPRHHETAAPEGMGAMETDDENLSLFEIRDLGGPLEVDQWTGLAVFIAKMVGEATDDDRLRND
ncbi:DUF4157 domain-containing protein [Streptomyces sp. NPDC046831]|uniref:eCIS core domain-containing protein n=1 Tax=Streptomyces sp. NPDC046831 TaxID=3154805 RepID=UPI0033C85C88